VRVDWSGGQVPALVRGKELGRHRALVSDPKRVAAVLIAQGAPRAWQRSLDAAVRGVSEALEAPRPTAESVLAAAAAKVRQHAASLVDEHAVQVHAVAISLAADGQAELATAGSCRAYLDRRGQQRRVSSAEATKGLADAFAFSRTSEPLEPGDVVVLGPSHLFGVLGVARLAKLLAPGEGVDARRIVRGLLTVPGLEETGAAAVALRLV